MQNKRGTANFGFVHYLLNSPTVELQQVLENVIYFEFVRRRYKVCTGKVDDREVDFVVQGEDDIPRYVQVAVTVKDEAKLKRELDVFRGIRDNYPKYILTLDGVFAPDHDGIKTLNAYDFLLGLVNVD